jgi:hypothetical protein
MATDVEELTKELREHFNEDGEIERVCPSCNTCLLGNKCTLRPAPWNGNWDEPTWCYRFVPRVWKDCVLINGKWWA